MNIEEALNLLDRLVCEQRGEALSRVQQAVIKGVLAGQTYDEIKKTDPAARGYTVGYLGRYVAYHLWNLLTDVFLNLEILEYGEKVRSKNLWECITRSIEQEDIEDSVHKDRLLDRKLCHRYRLLEHLVRSDFSQTYLAEDEQLPDRPLCVVKQLKSSSPETIQKFQQESRVLHRLGDCDRIPKLLASFEENGEFYIIHEFIEGQPLSHELIESQPWQEEEAIVLLRDILEVLEFVHQQGVIHRDLHPDNLIRSASDSKIVLVDFGAVKEISSGQILSGNTTSLTPNQGTSAYYIPPEQAFGIPKFSSDLYALGIIGIQALSGLRPRKFKKFDRQGNLIWRDKAQVTSEFADILDRMVCYHFNDRYLSATEALRDLQCLGKFDTKDRLVPLS
ncbi:MAG: serine/threonine-protein kinase [Geitlerinemataceae cyanobacterium]